MSLILGIKWHLARFFKLMDTGSPIVSVIPYACLARSGSTHLADPNITGPGPPESPTGPTPPTGQSRSQHRFNHQGAIGTLLNDQLKDVGCLLDGVGHV